MANWHECPTEADEPITLWLGLYLVDVMAGLVTFAIFAGVFHKPFSGLIIAAGVLYGAKRMRQGHPPGYLLHLVHWLEVGYRIPGFDPPRAKDYAVW